ncbi:hypothetical protein ACFSHQ_14355 [Gemmobacter lanyuensis]
MIGDFGHIPGLDQLQPGASTHGTAAHQRHIDKIARRHHDGAGHAACAIEMRKITMIGAPDDGLSCGLTAPDHYAQHDQPLPVSRLPAGSAACAAVPTHPVTMMI